MKITRVDLILLRLPIPAPFETSYGRLNEFDRLLLKAYTPDFIAYGECSAWPDMGFTYETTGTAREVLKNYFLPAVMGQDLGGPEDFDRLCGRFRGHPMAKAALENSLWVLKALEEGKSLSRTLGGEKDKIEAGVSIGIQPRVEDLIEKIRQFTEAGYTNVKLKIKPGVDVSWVEAVRKAFPDLPLRADANNVYSLADGDLLKKLDPFQLMALEQPLGMEQIWDHSLLQKRLDNPICLDESIQSPYSARLALELQACRIINIKQCRLGGLGKALEVHDICQKGGVGNWCGGMYETGIGRAVLMALSSLPNFIYPTDTSASNRYFARDIAEPEFRLNPDGTIDVPQGPGLGVEVNEKILEGYLIGREVFRV